MDLGELFRAAGRRWYVLIAGLILTAGFVYMALQFVPVAYDVKSSILLLPPQSALEEAGGNPFLGLGGLDVVAGVLAKSLTDSDSQASIVPAGSTAEYTVQEDASVSGSVLEVAASDESADGAFRTLHAVLNLATTRLEELQDSVDASSDSQVRLMVITNNTAAEPDIASLARVLIVVGAAGLVVTSLLAVSVDAAVRRRKLARANRKAGSVPGDDTATPAAALPAVSSVDQEVRLVMASESQ